jgi:hypothetical protein
MGSILVHHQCANPKCKQWFENYWLITSLCPECQTIEDKNYVSPTLIEIA